MSFLRINSYGTTSHGPNYYGIGSLETISYGKTFCGMDSDGIARQKTSKP
jgi:hypothetical protein